MRPDPSIHPCARPASLRLVSSLPGLACVAGLLVSMVLGHAKSGLSTNEVWSLKPVVRPPVPRGESIPPHPIDAFLAQAQQQRHVKPLPVADKRTWLRRASIDLTGLAPTLEEQDAFLADDSTGAFDRVLDRLLNSSQHGVRYGRHWLDVLRYADWDENMPAAPGIHYWRDWVIQAVNRDLPFDDFARAQILGNRAARRRIISAEGHLTAVEPRPEDVFALGFLARGATSASDADQQLAFSAVETISSAFLGMTVGCAKCHDHFYDPIKQADFYSMKSLFDPLVLKRIDLATPEQVFELGRKMEDYEAQLKRVVDAMRAFIEPHHTRLYEERLSAFPPEVQAAIRKPERQRTGAEQKIYDDYYPILRIDPVKIKAVMKPEEIRRYDEYLRQLAALKRPEEAPVFWTVAEDAKRAAETRYVLLTGDPARPKKNQPVPPGFPFAPKDLDFRHGNRETFVDWLTAPENPLFARVVVNRIWQWHFGTGLHASATDFGALGGKPIHPELLDWLASEFVAQGYRMKWLHRFIMTSDAYRRASAGPREWEQVNQPLDPGNLTYWKFPLRRLEAEPVRDMMLAAAGKLDLSLGGKSYGADTLEGASTRRAAYMSRGYRSFADVMPAFLQTFDSEDGRAVCSRRTQTVTAPQALWLMNSELSDRACAEFGARLNRESLSDPSKAVELGYRTLLGRLPNAGESSAALEYFRGDPARARGFAWILFNLDEFLYIR